jgi:hypothetical protein
MNYSSSASITSPRIQAEPNHVSSVFVVYDKAPLVALIWQFVRRHPRVAESFCNRLQLEFARRKHRLLFTKSRTLEGVHEVLCLLHAYFTALGQLQMLTPAVVADMQLELDLLVRMMPGELSEEERQQFRKMFTLVVGGTNVLPHRWIEQQIVEKSPFLKRHFVKDDLGGSYTGEPPAWRGEAIRRNDLPNITPIHTAPPMVTETTISSASGVVRAADHLASDDRFNAAITAGTRGWKPRWAQYY